MRAVVVAAGGPPAFPACQPAAEPRSWAAEQHAEAARAAAASWAEPQPAEAVWAEPQAAVLLSPERVSG